jgi:hypothetical protein
MTGNDDNDEAPSAQGAQGAPETQGAPRRGVARLEGEFARLYAPYRNAEICLIDKPSPDIHLFELRIREGRRITQVELGPDAALELSKALAQWVAQAGAIAGAPDEDSHDGEDGNGGDD